MFPGIELAERKHNRGRYILNSSSLNFVGTKPALSDELLGWLVVYRCEGGKLYSKLFEKGGR